VVIHACIEETKAEGLKFEGSPGYIAYMVRPHHGKKRKRKKSCKRKLYPIPLFIFVK
jgi:hypothetical protein